MHIARVTRNRFLRLGVRQWGHPTGIYVGKGYRSWVSRARSRPADSDVRDGDGWVMTLLVPASDPDKVQFAKASVVFVDEPRQERFPAGWRKAMAEYCIQWPASAVDNVAVWAALTPRQRLTMVDDYLAMLRRDSINWPGTNELRWKLALANLDALTGAWRDWPAVTEDGGHE